MNKTLQLSQTTTFYKTESVSYTHLDVYKRQVIAMFKENLCIATTECWLTSLVKFRTCALSLKYFLEIVQDTRMILSSSMTTVLLYWNVTAHNMGILWHWIHTKKKTNAQCYHQHNHITSSQLILHSSWRSELNVDYPSINCLL